MFGKHRFKVTLTFEIYVHDLTDERLKELAKIWNVEVLLQLEGIKLKAAYVRWLLKTFVENEAGLQAHLRFCVAQQLAEIDWHKLLDTTDFWVDLHDEGYFDPKSRQSLFLSDELDNDIFTSSFETTLTGSKIERETD
jgi:hypothetical protein